MAFVVCHMEKYGAGNLGSLQRHNQRETENHANKDINTQYSYLNYGLVNAYEISYPNKIDTRIVEGVETNQAIRKDAVRVCRFIVSASPELFDDPERSSYILDPMEARASGKAAQYFQAATDFFKERYGEKNVVFASVHLDETTPHMHLGVVLITADHKLSAKRIFNHKELQDLQKALPEHLQQQGFDVEKRQSRNEHLDELDYKAKQAEIRAELAQEKAVEAEKTLVEKRAAWLKQKRL
ncbi:MobV family relaxase [Sporolactobacillus pectinivorans]|uniref:MobV family relaxase n=1 Tax=Sporolactobacillus pectinivorans TaxID=1591408 RepID=UPI000C26691C|nr:MobV family relaxase [Sporolactobacillus pectinivorans]